MTNYKLPKCFLGRSRTVIGLNGEQSQEIITEADVNSACGCVHEMQAFWCMEGHLTECHAGMSCEEAECSHYEAEHLDDESFWNEEDLP